MGWVIRNLLMTIALLGVVLLGLLFDEQLDGLADERRPEAA